MSIKYQCETGWIVSHPEYFEATPTKVIDSATNSLVSCSLTKDLFDVKYPFNAKSVSSLCDTDTSGIVKRRRKKRKASEIDETAEAVQTLAFKLLTPEVKSMYFPKEHMLFSQDDDDSSKRNNVSLDKAEEFYQLMKDKCFQFFCGENNEPYAVLSKAPVNCKQHERFLFPPNTKFYCNDVLNLPESIFQCQFDLIVMDPPWENKYIKSKRKRCSGAGYSHLHSESLETIPIEKLLSPSALVVVWCTNSTFLQNHLLNSLFPAWSLTYIQKIYWLKVTSSGEPVSEFRGSGLKQPYETIIIGRHSKHNLTNRTVNPSSPKLLVSTPSSINSHKPPILPVLKTLYSSHHFGSCCELFARYLTPGFTSVGNEVIKLQHESLYIKQSTPDTTHNL